MEPAPLTRVHPTGTLSGFSLVEMMVVLAIITIITSVVLTGQTNFNKTILLTDTAYQVATSIREMQSFGISSRRYKAGATDVQNSPYGIHVDSVNNNKFILFADTSNTPTPSPALSNCALGTAGTPDAKTGNCLYDTDATPDAIVETHTFTRGFTISKFCGYVNTTTKYCSDDTVTPLTAMDIVFVRSSTESAINVYRGTSWNSLISAEIYITSADGSATRGVCVSRVGQVSVTQSTCQ